MTSTHQRPLDMTSATASPRSSSGVQHLAHALTSSSAAATSDRASASSAPSGQSVVKTSTPRTIARKSNPPRTVAKTPISPITVVKTPNSAQSAVVNAPFMLKRTNVKRPDVMRADVKKLDVKRPDVMRSDVTWPDVTRANGTRPDVTQRPASVKTTKPLQPRVLGNYRNAVLNTLDKTKGPVREVKNAASLADDAIIVAKLNDVQLSTPSAPASGSRTRRRSR